MLPYVYREAERAKNYQRGGDKAVMQALVDAVFPEPLFAPIVKTETSMIAYVGQPDSLTK